MEPRQYVCDAIAHQDSDVIPYTLDLTGQARKRLCADEQSAAILNRSETYIETAYYDGWLTETEPGSGYFRDAYGVTWNRHGADKDIGVIDKPILPQASFHGYVLPPLDESRLRREYDKFFRRESKAFRLAGLGFSLFERAWTLRGMENFLIDMAAEPTFAASLLEKITEYHLRIVQISLEYPFDGFHFGDDWGQQQGMIMGAKYWRQRIKPQLKRLYEPVKAAGRIVSQHSCGDIEAVFPDLIEIGLDVYQTVQPEIYDFAKIKREYGKDLTFWGGISTQKLLPFASPQKVKDVTRETMRLMGKGGGYITAPTHAVPQDVPPENILAFLQAAQTPLL